MVHSDAETAEAGGAVNVPWEPVDPIQCPACSGLGRWVDHDDFGACPDCWGTGQIGAPWDMSGTIQTSDDLDDQESQQVDDRTIASPEGDVSMNQPLTSTSEDSP
jgi:hypothetical protein